MGHELPSYKVGTASLDYHSAKEGSNESRKQKEGGEAVGATMLATQGWTCEFYYTISERK